MDLSKYNLDQYAEIGADMELENPETSEVFYQSNGEPVTIKLLGKDSKIWRNKNREYQKKRINSAIRRRKGDDDLVMSDEEVCDILACCTIGWSGIEEDGKELEFSYDNALQMYLDHNWIREQVDMFIGDRANGEKRFPQGTCSI